MNHPEFSPERTMITIDPQDLLRMFEKAQLSDPQPSMRGTRPRSYVRGSGLFSSFRGTPLLMNESKDASAPGHWKNLKSSVHNAVASAKNKVKKPKYNTLMEEDSPESHETDESDELSDGNDIGEENEAFRESEDSANNLELPNQDAEPVNKRKKRSTARRVVNKQVKPHHSESIVQKELVTTGSFSCDVCSKGFYNQSSLTRHAKSLHWKQKLECVKCGQLFTRQSNLSKHESKCAGSNTLSMQTNQ
jgi:hypothetical protein